MNRKTLPEMCDSAPFKLFEIHLTDGRALTVATANHLFLMPKNSEFSVVSFAGGFCLVDSPQVASAGRNASRAKAQ